MASILKVDTIQDQDGNNIINESANTITIGALGDTITIPSGATLANSGIITGFESTGIDDNATSTAITIDSNGQFSISGSTTSFDTTGSSNGLQAYYETDTGLATLGSYSSGGTTSLTFHTNVSGGASSEKMRIDYQGNVGIGTSSPNTNLDIRDTGANNGGTLTLGTTNNTTGGDYGAIQFYKADPSGAGAGVTASITATDGANSGANSELVFATGDSGIANTERMRIDSSGNVGIGTSSPGQKVAIAVDDSNTAIGNGITNLELSNINGTNGTYSRILFNDNPGGAGACTLGVKLTDTTNNYGQFEFLTRGSSGASTRMVIDPNGNVGIGTSSPSSKLSIYSSDTTVYSASSVGGQDSGSTLKIQNISNQANCFASIDFNTNNNRVINRIVSSHGNSTVDGFLSFITEGGGTPAERMRIDGNGRVYIGTTSQITGTHNHTLGVSQSSNDTPITTETNSTNARYAIDFFNPNGRVGYIMTTGSSTSFNTSSDYRLKENVSYDFDATTRLKQLRPARFNFIADADTTVDGFLAHEVSSVVPEAISGEKDAVEVWKEGEELPEGVSVGDNKLDENGNTIPEYQGIDQSKLVPLLVKTIQELEARITALETNQP